jgi:MFS family permease
MSTTLDKPFSKQQNFILRTIGLIILLEYMDVSIINTSLPQIAFSLQVNPINLKIALTVYLLAFGLFIPAVRWVVDRFGVNKILMLSITGFLLSSIACGLSVNLTMLTIARFLQGMFAAFSSPVARIIIIKLYPTERAKLFAKISSIFLLGPLLGPLLGGAITTWLNWRYIFFINIPLGLFTLWAIRTYFPIIASEVEGKFDFVGFALLALSIVLALLFIDTITMPGINNIWKILSIASSFIFMGLYLFHNKMAKYPVLDFAIFKNNTFRFFSLILVAIRMLGMNLNFIAPLFVQTKLGYTAFHAGLLMLPSMIGAIVCANVFKYLIDRVDKFKLFQFAFIGKIIAQLLISYCFLQFNISLFIVTLFIWGCTSSLMMALNSQYLYADLSNEQMSPAAVISSSIMQLSRGFAIAAIAMLLIITSGQDMLFAHTALPSLSYAIVMWISAGLLVLTTIFLRFKP